MSKHWHRQCRATDGIGAPEETSQRRNHMASKKMTRKATNIGDSSPNRKPAPNIEDFPKRAAWKIKQPDGPRNCFETWQPGSTRPYFDQV
jgi:hypothetical protein